MEMTELGQKIGVLNREESLEEVSTFIETICSLCRG
jgi:hypothetical protein